jgi:hypothetical protein
MLRWYQDIQATLAKEPETWLAYLYGQHYFTLKKKSKSKYYYHGKLFLLIMYIYTVFKRTSFADFAVNKKCKFLVYAGTLNQKSALNSTIKGLKGKGESVLVLSPEALITKDEIKSGYYNKISYKLGDSFKSLVISIFRIKEILSNSKSKSSELLKSNLDKFLLIHHELAYFDRILGEVEPSFIVISSDHGAKSRCLLALARLRNIETVYMQHASVSQYFPALNFDFSFLDGAASLDIYRQCEKNRIDSSSFATRRLIYLSGQKKEISNFPCHKKKIVGLAINQLDRIPDVVDLISYLHCNDINVRLRWHPRFGRGNVRDLLSKVDVYNVDLSDPSEESLGNFFSKLYCLVASNSSIHLESALCGVPTIYYDVTKPDHLDYYGYVKNGVAIHALNNADLKIKIKKIYDGNLLLNHDAVRYYSATHGTDWEGDEGNLVAEILIAHDQNRPPVIEPIIF